MYVRSFIVISCFILLWRKGYSEFVGNEWPDNGNSWPGFANSVYIMYNNGPSIPYDGHIHAFHANIASSGAYIEFQIWREGNVSGSYILIGQQGFTTTAANVAATNSSFLLPSSIEVKQGDRIGFWSENSVVPVARYFGDFVRKAFVFKQSAQAPVEGTVLTQLTSLNKNEYFALGVTLETQPLIREMTTTEPTTEGPSSSVATTTTEPVPTDREYGRLGLMGEEWLAVSQISYLSLLINFTEPIIGGYLSRFQIYSLKRDVDIKFQIWRTISNTIGSRNFLLVDELSYTTKLVNSFENTSIWNANIIDGDLIGVTTIDANNKGIPIGWEQVTGNGERIYKKATSTKAELPIIGRTYKDYELINNHNQLAMVVYISDDKKTDDGSGNVTLTTSSMAVTTSGPMQSTTAITEELIIGNKDVVDNSGSSEEFQPFASVTVVLTDLEMRRDGFITSIGFYATVAKPLEVGIFRPIQASCSRPRCYEKIVTETVNITAAGPVILSFEDSPIPVLQGDVLGFYNMDPLSFVVGRIAVGGRGDVPYLTIGPTNLNEVTEGFNQYLNGYKYAIYAIMAAVPTTTTTTTTTSTTTTTQTILIKGVSGNPGSEGPVGSTGPPGEKGSKGAIGPTGATGDKGDVGDLGDQGVMGSTGATGERGLNGSIGVVGDKGARGATGQIGDKGVRGDVGATGENGARGDQGEKGQPGLVGPDGFQGLKGEKGAQGDTGLEGEQGPPGPKGSQGITGDRGLPAIIALTNECSSQCAGENNVCTDTDLSFECGCGPGYDIESDGSCKDKDECESHNGMCQQICNNTLGSRSCSCFDGYTLSPNARTCIDIDECLLNTDDCTNGEQCFNEVGTFKCLIKQTVTAAQLVEIQELGSQNWWGLIALGLLIWAAVLSISCIILCIILCVDHKKNKSRKYQESYYGSSTNVGNDST